jgi:hypothetical protein
MPGDLPIKLGAEAGFKLSKEEKKEVTDHKNFARYTNKIETVGAVKKTTYAILCDGEGNIRATTLDSKIYRLDELMTIATKLKGLLDSGFLDSKEYENMRKQILEDINKTLKQKN